ncbi:MAG: aminotransferase class IV [Ginsengibacter sp.]
MAVSFFIHNNEIFKTNEKTISISQSPLRYGEGFFETILSINGELKLKELHFARIEKTFRLLKYRKIDSAFLDNLENQINLLLIKNKHLQHGRVRIMFFQRKLNGNHFISKYPDFILESFEVDQIKQLNKDGLTLNIFEDAVIPCDRYSQIKSNNYQPYLLAATYAKENCVDDAILLNMYSRVCETSISNIFILKKEKIITPLLSEGCIAGVMREYLLSKLKEHFIIEENQISLKDLVEADEVFITNSIRGIRWVKKINGSTYTNKAIKKIYRTTSLTK